MFSTRMLLVLFSAALAFVAILAEGLIITIPSTNFSTPIVQTLFTCSIGDADCNLSMHCAGQEDPHLGMEFWDPLITQVVVYQYTAPNTGLFRFSTENPTTTCEDTYLVTQFPKRCNDDIEITQQRRSQLDLDLTAGQTITAYVGSFEDICTAGQTVSLKVLQITHKPTLLPTLLPTQSPTFSLPTRSPTRPPTLKPTVLPSVSPSRNPTTSLPTKTPTLRPTLLPTLSPTTSKPTLHPTTSTPSETPTTSKPSQMPTKSPTHPIPTRSPTTSQPTVHPTTSKPSRSPTAVPSLSPTTSQPTLHPTTSRPSMSPTTSPTFVCRAGTYSPTGFSGVDGGCAPCQFGYYDMPTSTFRMDCNGLTLCEDNYWCGAGAVFENTYVPIVTHGVVDSTVVIASKREVSVEFTKLITGQAFYVGLAAQEEDFPPGISLARATLSPSMESTFTVPLLVEADLLEGLYGEGENLFQGMVKLRGHYEHETSQSFTSTVQVNIQLVSVVINPSAFDYKLIVGQLYSSAVSPLPSSEVLNPLCTDSLVYLARRCNDLESVLRIPNTTTTTAVLPPNLSFGKRFDFEIDLRQVTRETDFNREARVVHECIVFDMTLTPINVTFNKTIEVTVKLLEPCPPGTYSASGTNEWGCTTCVDDSYQPNSGSTACFPVSPGSEVTANKTGMVPCDIGWYSTLETDRCTRCAKGSYTDEPSSTICKPCPSSTFPITLFEGATSLEHCTTSATQNAFKSDQGILVACPQGTTCDFDGATVPTLKVNPGYYRTSNQSLDVRPCKPGFCEPVTQRHRILSYSVQQDTKYCTPHHQGHLCEICESGYVHRGPNRLCELCVDTTSAEDAERVAGIMIGLALAVVIISVIVLLRSYEHYKPKISSSQVQDDDDDDDELTIKLSWYSKKRIVRGIERVIRLVDVGGTPLKITIGYFQVVAGMAIGLMDFLPGYFQTLADWFSLFSLDFIKIFDFGCSLPEQTHMTSLLFATLVPVLCYGVLFAVERTALCCVMHKQALHIGFMNLYLWIMFLVYPSIAKTIFQTFTCIEFDDESSVLKTDPQIDCGSEDYHYIQSYAIICIILFVIGIPFACYVVLDRQRFQLNAAPDFEPRISLAYREKNIQVQGTRMLWHSYSPKRYNFEVFELVRKLLQTSVFVFVSTDSAGQVIFLLAICAVAVVVLGWLDPYVRRSHNALAQWAQWNIFAIAFVALLNRMQLTSDSESAVLDDVLLLCLISVPVLALAIGMKGSKVARKWAKKWFRSATDAARQTEMLERRMNSRRMSRKDDTNAVHELQAIITDLEDDHDNKQIKDKMMTLVCELESKLKEEAAVAKIERSILLDDRGVQDQLKDKIEELVDENETCKFAIKMLHEQHLTIKARYEREITALQQAKKKSMEQQQPKKSSGLQQQPKKSSGMMGRRSSLAAVQDIFSRTRATSVVDNAKRRMTGMLFGFSPSQRHAPDDQHQPVPMVFHTNSRPLADSDVDSFHSRSAAAAVHTTRPMAVSSIENLGPASTRSLPASSVGGSTRSMAAMSDAPPFLKQKKKEEV